MANYSIGSFFANLKARKVAVAVSLVILIALFAAITIYFYVPSNYTKIQATVASYHAGVHSLDETLDYTVTGQSYSIQYQDYISSIAPSTVPVYYNPTNPSEAKVRAPAIEQILAYIIASVFILGIIFRMGMKINLFRS